jgi:aspartate aminotransferase
MVPGSAFHAPGHVRLSYATSMERLSEAMDRLDAFTA